jgi:hypothetical protein
MLLHFISLYITRNLCIIKTKTDTINNAVSRASSQLFLRGSGLHILMIILVIRVRNATALSGVAGSEETPNTEGSEQDNQTQSL